MTTITSQTVGHIANLSNIPVTAQEEEKLAAGFTTTLEVVDKLMEVDTNAIEPTHQVTGLENVFRDDVVVESTMFTQDEALMNAKRTHNGFIVVDQLVGE